MTGATVRAYRPKEVDFDQAWSSLRQFVEDIMNMKPISNKQWQYKIKDAYDICFSSQIDGLRLETFEEKESSLHPNIRKHEAGRKYGEYIQERLYDEIKTCIKDHVKLQKETIENVEDEQLLQEYFRMWTGFHQAAFHINQLFDYLNNVVRFEKNKIGCLALQIWREDFVISIQSRLIQSLLNAIDEDRRGNTVEFSDVVAGVIKSFIQLELEMKESPNKTSSNKQSTETFKRTQFYKTIFEESFLKATETYYSDLAQKTFVDLSCRECLKTVIQLLEHEEMLAKKYLIQGSMREVIELCQHVMIKVHKQKIHHDLVTNEENKEDQITSCCLSEFYSKKTGWDDLPDEMKFEVLQYLNDSDRVKIASCCFQLWKEIFNAEENDIEKVTISHNIDATKKYFTLNINNKYIIDFEQLANLCQIACNGKTIWKETGISKNMAHEFFEKILKTSKHFLRELWLRDVDFMIESIESYPNLRIFSFHNSSIDQSIGSLYSFLLKAKNIKNLIVDLSGTIENTNQIPSSVAFDLLSLERIYLKANCPIFASEFINRFNLSEDGRLSKIEVEICDKKQCSSVDQKLLNIFKKFKTIRTNVAMTKEQFIEMINSVQHLEYVFPDIDSLSTNLICVENLENCIQDFRERSNLILDEAKSFLPNQYVFKRQNGETLEISVFPAFIRVIKCEESPEVIKCSSPKTKEK